MEIHLGREATQGCDTLVRLDVILVGSHWGEAHDDFPGLANDLGSKY
jgi:hypothetical protein